MTKFTNNMNKFDQIFTRENKYVTRDCCFNNANKSKLPTLQISQSMHVNQAQI